LRLVFELTVKERRHVEWSEMDAPEQLSGNRDPCNHVLNTDKEQDHMHPGQKKG